jgi:Asp-tRNA(Asn)/Glu-tRNA(Gln) amidotransferase A subunit family amidase
VNIETLFDKISSYSPSERRSVFAAFASLSSMEQQLKQAKSENKPLAGHFCFVKDNFDLPGFSTNASSLFLEDVRPGPHSAGKLIQRLQELGLTIAGKTHMNEFAYGLDGANPHMGNCPHPFLPGHCSGGSSSGSAWTVAKGLVPIAFGTDTGGSIRVPAAFCGLYGFRLAPDDWAKDGCFPLAPRFDSVGWFTRSLADMSFFTSKLLTLPASSPTPLRIANATPESSNLTPAVQSLFPEATLLHDFTSEKLSAERVKAYSILQSLQALEIHKEWVDSYADLYDPAVRALILRGRNWTNDEISSAENTVRDMEKTFETLFKDADLILLPVSELPAPPSPMTPQVRHTLLAATVPASLAGLPVLTLPVNTPEGPLGIQCILPPRRWKHVLATLLSQSERHQ